MLHHGNSVMVVTSQTVVVCSTTDITNTGVGGGVGGGGLCSAQREYTHAKTVVKHNRAWSPHGWVTVSCHALRASFLGVKFCADSIPNKKSFGWDCKPRSRVYTHTHVSHTHLKNLVVHVRVGWIMGNTRTPTMYRRLGGAILSQLAFPWEMTRICLGRNPNGTIKLLTKLLYDGRH